MPTCFNHPDKTATHILLSPYRMVPTSYICIYCATDIGTINTYDVGIGDAITIEEAEKQGLVMPVGQLAPWDEEVIP